MAHQGNTQKEAAYPCWNHVSETMMSFVHTNMMSLCNAYCLEDSSASLVYLSLVVSGSLCMRETDIVSPSIIIGGAASFARMISCDTKTLVLNCATYHRNQGPLHTSPAIMIHQGSPNLNLIKHSWSYQSIKEPKLWSRFLKLNLRTHPLHLS